MTHFWLDPLLAAAAQAPPSAVESGVAEMNRAPWLDPLLVLVLLLNFLLLGAMRLRPVVYSIAFQGIVLSLILSIVHGEHSVRGMLLIAATLALRGVLIPRLLFTAMRRADVRWQVESVVGPITSLLIGVVGTAAALSYAKSLPVESEHSRNLLIPTALSTVLTAFIILITRHKAINLVLGYMVLENGIFVFGLLLVEAMPFLVEIGVLLDLFVGIFLMGIIIHHVAREFESAGAESLTSLRE
jgi:hydrogenase-4 component E